MCKDLAGPRMNKWINMGGQLMPEADVDQLRSDIKSKQLNSWHDIHNRYHKLWQEYSHVKYRHGYSVLCELLKTQTVTETQWIQALETGLEIQLDICDKAYHSRKKDFDNPFIQAVYRDSDEMAAAMGTIEGNDFIKQLRRSTEQFKRIVEQLKVRCT
jgi:hypothetical protein